ncbi:solute carrier family 22 member 24-like isoform X3 [Zootermopsis nevadensis]|uniref:solute carrier family 22 member 24-like isoform X3 n=1 Tax=Zootermopsis nevadensis TaxID=136037 RepID=UPI000B8E20FD|nr:solute carrier family 22 member 24-like isoform X3 [Zootermopsis nevadensis]
MERSELKEKCEEEEEEEDIFDELMEHVGMDGRFQFWFNLIFNMAFVLTVAMPSFNLILAVTLPTHWCHVPGRNKTNYTVAEWKSLTVPRVENSEDSFSKCSMYNLSFPVDVQTPQNLSNAVFKDTESCRHGWDYDTTWYSLTAPSQEDWVCEKEVYVPNTLLVARVGEVVGTLVFGQLGDTIGRRPVLFLGVATLVLGRCVVAFTAGTYVVFLLANFVASLPISVVFQSPLIIGMEISSASQRALLTMLQFVGWTSGMCVMPMVAWATGGEWKLFMVLTSVPCAAVFLAFRTLTQILYYTIVLSVAGMSGNPFLNFLLQSLIELPGFLIGRALCDRLGRRWSQAGAFVFAGCFQVACLITVVHEHLLWLLVAMVLVVKLSLTVAAYSSYLQCMELYPTCLRQTGTSVGFLIANALGALGPYIVYLGTVADPRYPYAILSVLCLVGATCATLLPETLNQKLPETVQDASHFGMGQKYWSLPQRKRKDKDYQSAPTK